MLMSTKANRYAHQLMKARASGASIQPLTTTGKITIEDAYEIALLFLKLKSRLGLN